MRQLMHSFVGLTAPKEILDAVRRGEIASFCLFSAKNIESPKQVRALTESLRVAALEGGQLPPLIAIDQEGGQLIAITGGATELPGNMALGATRSMRLASAAGKVLGQELLAMGINMDLAPVLDVNINPANPVVGVRSFGDDPALVAELGQAFIRGVHETGALAVAKHFPGHGDTHLDSHFGASVIDHTLERVQSVELFPFRAAIEAHVDAILTSHVIFAVFDTESPATLSRPILNGLLRRDMGFDGLIISDAMDMFAVAQYGTISSLQRALDAGNDLLLLGHLSDQLGLNRIFAKAGRPDALRRIQAVQEQIANVKFPDLDVVGSTEHQAIAQEIADCSITVVRDLRQQLPLRPDDGRDITVVTARPVNLTPADTSLGAEIQLESAIRRRYNRVQHFELPDNATDKDIQDILAATEKSHYVIVGTINAVQDASQIELVNVLLQRGQHPIVIALRTPYDLTVFPAVETYLCAYSIRAVTMEALAKVLFGEIEAQGRLPCFVPNEPPQSIVM